MIAFGEIPNKMKYEFDTAFNRFMREYQIENFKMNEHFPVNTISLIRGAIVAQKIFFLMIMWKLFYVECGRVLLN